MKDDLDSIRIVEEIMFELRGLARTRAVSVSDIVHEALGEYLITHTNAVNLFDVIHSIEHTMNRAERFVTITDPSGLVIFIKSPIRYLYRPELKYEVKIVRNNEVSVGKLNIIIRSHDIETIIGFSDFVNLWIDLECKYLQSRAEQITYETESGYFGRQIFYPEGGGQRNGQAVGDAISDYICVFDELLKYYFTHRNGRDIEKLFFDRLRDGKLTI
ncbi:MAG: hypothetical protein FWC66_01440 [Oscillospiraceae bacterium]|nr:hypothetical protein [Oscillospiraceae bacterium]